MDEKQLQLLFNEYAKNKGFKDFGEFKSLMGNEGSRKVFFEDSNKELGFKDFNDFNETIGAIKKKEFIPSPSSDISSVLQKGNELARGAALGKVSSFEKPVNKPVKNVPQSIEEGIAIDKGTTDYLLKNQANLGIQQPIPQQGKPQNSTLGGIWNTLVGGAASIAGGVAEVKDLAMEAIGVPSVHTAKRKQIEDFINKARTSSSSVENEQNRQQFDFTNGVQASDIKAMMFSAPRLVGDVLAGAATSGSSFFLQSVNDNARELESNPKSEKMSPVAKMGHLYTRAGVQAILEMMPVNKLFKSTGLSKPLVDRVSKEITQELIEKGTKATAQEIEELAIKKLSSLPEKIKRVGLKAAAIGKSEGITEASQSAADDTIKLLTNKAVGEDVFDAEDIVANMGKNIINSGVMGAAFGGAMGGFGGALQSTNKAIRNELSKVQTPQDLENIRLKIAEQAELGNITEEEAQAANITTQQYAQIAAKIPTEISSEKKYALIGGIEQREGLKKAIEETQKEISEIDEAFPEYKQGKQDQIELLEAKLNQTNDYINEIVSDKKTEYTEKDGKYFKKDTQGNKSEISKQYYELATAVKENEKQKEQPQPTPQEQTPTILEQDVVEAEQLTPEITKIEETVTETPTTKYKGEHKIVNAPTTADKLDGGDTGFDWKEVANDHDLSDPATKESYRILKTIKDNPDAEVTIYRSVPKGTDKINEGDWITLSKTYAKEHGMHESDPSQDMPVISMKVKAKDIGSDGNDLNEFAYNPKTKQTPTTVKSGEGLKETFETKVKIEETLNEKYKGNKNVVYHGSPDISYLNDISDFNSKDNMRNAPSKYMSVNKKPSIAENYSLYRKEYGEKSGIAAFELKGKKYTLTKSDINSLTTNEKYEDFYDKKKEEGYDYVEVPQDGNNIVVLNNNAIKLLGKDFNHDILKNETTQDTPQQKSNSVESEGLKDESPKNFRGVKYSDIFVGGKGLEDILDDNKLSDSEKNTVRDIFSRNMDYFKFDKAAEQRFQEGAANSEDITDILDAIHGANVANESSFYNYNDLNYNNVKDAVRYVSENANEFPPKVVKAVSEIKERLENSDSGNRLFAIDINKELGIKNENTKNPIKAETKVEQPQKLSEVSEPSTKEKAKTLEQERDSKVMEVGKPEIKVEFVKGEDLANMGKDPMKNKREHAEIKERYKNVKQLIDCLWLMK